MGSNENLTVHNEDARPWLRRSEGDYDAIFVDAYRQPYIPFYLATEEFFELVRDRLAPGGVVVVNAGHPEGNDDLEKVLGRTMAEVFPTVLRDPIEPTNTLLVASEAPAPGGTDDRRPRGGCRPSCGTWRRSRRRGSGRGSRAARSTPTTARPSNG